MKAQNMAFIKRLSERITERHILALILLCYFVTLIDPRNTTGTVGYMLSNYSNLFVNGLAAWSLLAAGYLLVHRVKAIGLFISGFPIVAYTVMGLWFVTHTPSAPIAAFFVHFAMSMALVYLIKTRLRGVSYGHLDNTIPPSTD